MAFRNTEFAAIWTACISPAICQMDRERQFCRYSFLMTIVAISHAGDIYHKWEVLRLEAYGGHRNALLQRDSIR